MIGILCRGTVRHGIARHVQEQHRTESSVINSTPCIARQCRVACSIQGLGTENSVVDLSLAQICSAWQYSVRDSIGRVLLVIDLLWRCAVKWREDRCGRGRNIPSLIRHRFVLRSCAKQGKEFRGMADGRTMSVTDNPVTKAVWRCRAWRAKAYPRTDFVSVIERIDEALGYSQ